VGETSIVSRKKHNNTSPRLWGILREELNNGRETTIRNRQF
jgi:hypothetical protein